jgi:hypothetical protein
MRVYPWHFGGGYLILLAAVFGISLLTVAAFSGRLPALSHHAGPVAECSSPACAEIGDDVAYTVRGKVVSVSEPAPGWRCVQTEAATEQLQKCAKK